VILVYDASLDEMWRAEIWDGTGASGPVGFDFENDGDVNVVYSDEAHVWAYSPSGDVIYEAERGSVTLVETVGIADVDLDGHANFTVGSNEPQFGLSEGLDVLTNSGTSWAYARGLWNQHAYVDDLVGELGTPLFVPGGMEALDGFRIASPACVAP
jgi:hypothetical protein